MRTTTSAIWLAKSQVGYREGRTSSGSYNNDQKYSDQLPGFDWSDRQPWCATFVQWCLWQVGVDVPPGARSASCYYSAKAYRDAGRWSSYPVVGGQVFYGPNGSTHTGIVYRYDDTYTYAIEGNTNSTGSPEGNGVYRKKRVRRDDWVFGYGIPYYQGKANSPSPYWKGRNMGG